MIPLGNNFHYHSSYDFKDHKYEKTLHHTNIYSPYTKLIYVRLSM